MYKLLRLIVDRAFILVENKLLHEFLLALKERKINQASCYGMINLVFVANNSFSDKILKLQYLCVVYFIK